jgi:hypothetical protein
LVYLATALDAVNDSIASVTNTGITALASAARVASVNSADLTNKSCSGADIIIDCTARAGASSVVFTVQGKCPVSNQYYPILVSAAIVAVGVTVLRIHPGHLAAANTVANASLPLTFRVSAAHANGDSISYSVGVNLVR